MSGATKTVGVLGGMGPAATLDFFARVLAASNAKRDSDHIRLLIDCNPHVPDRNAAVAGSGPSPAPALIAMARGLKAAGAELLVMPCNTAHAVFDEIKAATDLPTISIIDVTVESLHNARPQPHSVGILATTGCIDANLYQTALAKFGIVPLVLQHAARDRFMQVLARIKSGDTGAGAKAEMIAVAQTLIDAGAEAIIAACTEVPLVLNPEDLSVPLINSTDCLVHATIAAARGDIE